VAASGNLANIYFLGDTTRLTLEAIHARYPGLVEALVAHPGIGFVLVRSDALGALAIGRDGVHHLADGRIDGTDPLAPFGPRAADHLRRLDGFTHVGDLLVNSAYDAELDEVAAFEELVGSHGGFGGPQVRPFILAPTDLPYDGTPVVGAPAVHRLLVGWADALGVGPDSGATDAPLIQKGPLPRARGIGLVALLTGITSLLWLLIGVAAIVLAVASGEAWLVTIGIVVGGLGVAGLFVAVGLWRRRGWARMAALAYYALGVLQALAAVGSEGFGGLISAGLGSVIIAVLVFFYLTRPHVAAAFARSSAAPPTEAAVRSTADASPPR
jgi:hypothetical protein